MPSWVLTVPLATTVLTSLIGRFSGFRITPKQQPRQRGSASRLLVLPLLLLGLQLLPPRQASLLPSSGLGLVWALLTVLGLLVALRACWDCADPEPVPWLAVPLACELKAADGTTWRAPVEAISERGLDLLLPATPTPALNHGLQVEVQLLNQNGTTALSPLPAQVITTEPCRSRHVRISVHWSAGAPTEPLQRWLFCRPGCWQQRPAEREVRALGALLKRLLLPPRPRQAGHRSVVVQACGNGAAPASLQHGR